MQKQFIDNVTVSSMKRSLHRIVSTSTAIFDHALRIWVDQPTRAMSVGSAADSARMISILRLMGVGAGNEDLAARAQVLSLLGETISRNQENHQAPP